MPEFTPVGSLAFKFGFNQDDAPTGIEGFLCRSLEIKEEPEVFATATDGNGVVEAVMQSSTTKRKKVATFTGYIDDTFDVEAAGETGYLTYLLETYWVKSVSKPMRKGEFVEVSIEAEYYPGLPAPSH